MILTVGRGRRSVGRNPELLNENSCTLLSVSLPLLILLSQYPSVLTTLRLAQTVEEEELSR
jgi:hypothetical protein